jgi:hypothetical protein
MTTVRIAHAEPRPGLLENGEFQTLGHLVVLADDAGHRAVPVWLRGEPGEEDLAALVEQAGLVDQAGQPAEEITAGVPQELTARLLRAAGASMTGVDIEVTGADASELSPRAAVARIALRGAPGSREVTASLGLGLAMAVAAGVPVRLADEVTDRVAVAVAGDDLLGPLLGHVPPLAQAPSGRGLAGWPVATLPARRPRFEPRNLDFADGLDRWDLDHSSGREADPSRPGYRAAADGQFAVLSSAVSRPAGSAALVQAIYADDYRGATVTFGGQIRTEPLTEQAGLRLEILRHWWRTGRPREDHGLTVAGGGDWSDQEITVAIPHDADIIRFGVVLSGAGSIALRNPELRAAEPARGA